MTLNKKIIKCSRDYNKGQFATLEEGKDYSIEVSKSTVDHKKCVASITCKCGKAYKITEKPTGERIITNWSKHLKKCEYKKDQSIQHSLQNYFISPATAATTLTTTTITGGAAAEPCLTDSNATDQSDQSILESLLFTPLNELPISSADPSDSLPLIQHSISQSTFTNSAQHSLVPSASSNKAAIPTAARYLATNATNSTSLLEHFQQVTPLNKLPISLKTQPSSTQPTTSTHFSLVSQPLPSTISNQSVVILPSGQNSPLLPPVITSAIPPESLASSLSSPTESIVAPQVYQ